MRWYGTRARAMHGMRGMRSLLASVTIAGLVCGVTALLPLSPAPAADVQSSASGVEPIRLTTTETLVGAWTGRWQATDGAAGGSLGLVLTRVPGRDTIVGQFTFVAGAISRALRYEGRLDSGALRFPLVDDGHIVLEAGGDSRRPMTADRLSGAWVDQRGALPAPLGRIELQRAS